MSRFWRTAARIPRPDPDDHRDQDREERELRGCGDERAELLGHREPRLLRLAEVAVQEPPDVDPVLLRQGLVEPVALVEGRDGGRVLDRALAQVRRGRVAWHEVREQERDERDPEPEKDERDEAPRQESEEEPGRPLARPPRQYRRQASYFEPTADTSIWNWAL